MPRLRTWDERVRADRGGSGAPRSVEGGAETPVCLARFREGPSGRLRRDLDVLVEIYRKLLLEVVDHKLRRCAFAISPAAWVGSTLFPSRHFPWTHVIE